MMFGNKYNMNQNSEIKSLLNTGDCELCKCVTHWTTHGGCAVQLCKRVSPNITASTLIQTITVWTQMSFNQNIGTNTLNLRFYFEKRRLTSFVPCPWHCDI